MQTIDGQLVVTYSGIGKYTACRRMWHLSEYLGLKRKDEEARTGPLPFGGRIHTALEMWSRGKIQAPVDAWDGLMQAEYDFAAEQGFLTDKLDKEVKLGNVMLGNFPEWLEETGFWAEYEVLGVETALRDHLVVPVKIHDHVEPVTVKVLTQGKADLIVRRRSDGAVFVLDWKTISSLTEQAIAVMMKSPQLRIYKLLAQQARPDLVFYGGLYVFLRKVLQTAAAKPPFYAMEPLGITPVDERAYKIRLQAAIQDMAQTYVALNEGQDPDRVAYFTPSRVHCTSCPFRQPCDLMSSYPAGAVDMLAERYEVGNPFKRYEDLEDGWLL